MGMWLGGFEIRHSPSRSLPLPLLLLFVYQAAAGERAGSSLVFRPTFRGERRGEGVGAAASIEGIHAGALGDIGPCTPLLKYPPPAHVPLVSQHTRRDPR